MDPTGKREPQQIILGDEGGQWESFAYDVRDGESPHFFVTEDNIYGALARFSPDNPNWNHPWEILHAQGRKRYLMLFPNDIGDAGEFRWTASKLRARSNAQNHYPNSEGIDVQGNQLFFVCKNIKMLFTLNLDDMTYTRKSTLFGLFDNTPDQIERILEGESDLLYFTEEGGPNAGIHARDSDGSFFTILESHTYSDETTGLSWSPDGRFMYVAYQGNGLLFSIWRQDGAPFHQKSLDVKYHQTAAT